MKPAAFDYFRPASLEEAIDALADNPESKVLAGGQSLVPMMNMRLATPSALVDISRVDALRGIDVNGHLRIGAMASQAEVLSHEVVRQRWPLVTAALSHVGHPATRERGTFGGSLAHGDPAAELPAVMVALDGRLTVAGPSGTREISAQDFFQGYYTTDLGDDEILVEALIPSAVGRCWGFGEVVQRQGDYAMAGVAASLGVDKSGLITDARIALFSVSSRPVCASAAESRLTGTRLGDPDVAVEAAHGALEGVDFSSSSFFSADYRRDAVVSVLKRVLLDPATIPKDV